MSKPSLIERIASATGFAAKSFLGLGDVETNVVSSSTYRGSAFGHKGWLLDDNGIDRYFDFGCLNSIMNAYEKCAPVFSIVNKQAYTYINGTTEFESIADDNPATGKEVDKIKKLLKSPNPLQNQKQFEAQMAIYLRLFGYCVIYPIKPDGFPNSDAESLWIIPPYMCTFKYNTTSFFHLKNDFIKSIMIRYGDEKTTLKQKDVIIIKDVSPSFDNIVMPSSPIKPLSGYINNIIGITESKGQLINYRGALGILTPEIDPNGAIAVSDPEKEELQNGLLKYGLKKGQWKFIIANSAMKWQQMGVPYKDLMMTEWAEDDIMAVCDGLNYPFRLLSNTKTSSMNGTEVDSFKKILYQDFTIPFADMISEQMSEAFETEKYGFKIEKCYDHVAVLQEDDVKKNTARLILNNSLKIEYEQGLITLNEWLTALGYPTRPDADVRSTDVKQSGQPIAAMLGTTGVQSLIGVLTASNISEEARSATVQILFGISQQDADLMTQQSQPAASQQSGAAA